MGFFKAGGDPDRPAAGGRRQTGCYLYPRVTRARANRGKVEAGFTLAGMKTLAPMALGGKMGGNAPSTAPPPPPRHRSGTVTCIYSPPSSG